MTDNGSTVDVRPPGPNVWLSIAIMIAGGAFLAFAGWQAFSAITELLSTESFPVPGEQTQDLDDGLHEVYASLPGTIGIADLTVTNLDTGADLEIRATDLFVELDRPGRTYTLVAEFDVEQSGSYLLEVGGDAEGRAIFGPGFLSSFEGLVELAVPTVLGVALLLVGTIMLIVGMVRRRNHRPSVAGAGTPIAPPPYRAATPGAMPVPPEHVPGEHVPPTQPESPPAAEPEPPGGDGETPQHPFGSID